MASKKHHNVLAEAEALRTIEAVNECIADGFPLETPGGNKPSARVEAAKRMGIAPQTLRHRLDVCEREYGLKPGGVARQTFSVEPLPDGGKPSAEELIDRLAERHRKRKIRDDAAKLRKVKIHIGGPIGLAMFGDPHVDDDGCAWGDLKHDVELCRDTPGMLAVDVGDNSNNWVGRLQRLYAQQETTPEQALLLIEWLMTQMPWLLWEQGNHDDWNTEKGDPVEVMHRLLNRPGIHNVGGTRLELHLPAGPSCRMHVRHDFPGHSQFNPAHAMVRQTLWDYRDHIMACGHRHHAGYIPVWHNDPEPRLCHGFRVGTYKDFDKFARDKGLKEENWARTMAAVIDPDHADNPRRFVKPFFDLDDAAEYLAWRRQKHELGFSHD